MEKQYTYKPAVLRFRRWSRKKYAAFISLKRTVTIGCLSANVSERFQAKNVSGHTSVLSSENVECKEYDEEETIVNRQTTDISFPQLAVLLLTRTVQQPGTIAYADTLVNNISGKAEGFSIILSPSAFSFETIII